MVPFGCPSDHVLKRNSSSTMTSVSSYNDHAEQSYGAGGWGTPGDMYTISSDMEMFDDSGEQINGVQFTRLTVPKNSQIISAIIAVTDKGPGDGDSVALTSDIALQATVNPPDFENGARQDVQDRYNLAIGPILAWALPIPASASVKTVDLSAPFQEFVLQDEYSDSANAPTIIFRRAPGSTGKRTFLLDFTLTVEYKECCTLKPSCSSGFFKESDCDQGHTLKLPGPTVPCNNAACTSAECCISTTSTTSVTSTTTTTATATSTTSVTSTSVTSTTATTATATTTTTISTTTTTTRTTTTTTPTTTTPIPADVNLILYVDCNTVTLSEVESATVDGILAGSTLVRDDIISARANCASVVVTVTTKSAQLADTLAKAVYSDAVSVAINGVQHSPVHFDAALPLADGSSAQNEKRSGGWVAGVAASCSILLVGTVVFVIWNGKVGKVADNGSIGEGNSSSAAANSRRLSRFHEDDEAAPLPQLVGTSPRRQSRASMSLANTSMSSMNSLVPVVTGYTDGMRQLSTLSGMLGGMEKVTKPLVLTLCKMVGLSDMEVGDVFEVFLAYRERARKKIDLFGLAHHARSSSNTDDASIGSGTKHLAAAAPWNKWHTARTLALIDWRHMLAIICTAKVPRDGSAAFEAACTLMLHALAGGVDGEILVEEAVQAIEFLGSVDPDRSLDEVRMITNSLVAASEHATQRGTVTPGHLLARCPECEGALPAQCPFEHDALDLDGRLDRQQMNWNEHSLPPYDNEWKDVIGSADVPGAMVSTGDPGSYLKHIKARVCNGFGMFEREQLEAASKSKPVRKAGLACKFCSKLFDSLDQSFRSLTDYGGFADSTSNRSDRSSVQSYPASVQSTATHTSKFRLRQAGSGALNPSIRSSQIPAGGAAGEEEGGVRGTAATPTALPTAVSTPARPPKDVTDKSKYTNLQTSRASAPQPPIEGIPVASLAGAAQATTPTTVDAEAVQVPAPATDSDGNTSGTNLNPNNIIPPDEGLLKSGAESSAAGKAGTAVTPKKLAEAVTVISADVDDVHPPGASSTAPPPYAAATAATAAAAAAAVGKHVGKPNFTNPPPLRRRSSFEALVENRASSAQISASTSAKKGTPAQGQDQEGLDKAAQGTAETTRSDSAVRRPSAKERARVKSASRRKSNYSRTAPKSTDAFLN